MVMAESPAGRGADDSRSGAAQTAGRAIRSLALCAGLLCAAVGPAAAEQPEPPFAPLAGVPDYVVTMVGHDRDKQITRTITHHGKWTRIDTIEGELHITHYFFPNGPTRITIGRHSPDDAIAVTFEREAGQSSFWDDNPRNTGERQTLLGEACTVWSVKRERGGRGAKLSCVTDDGIELWRRYLDVSLGPIIATEATRIERRPVAASEVEPPRELFTLSWWLDGATVPTSTATPTDYETVLRQIGGRRHDLVRTTRRHDPWTYVEETASDQWRELRVASSTLEFRFAAADTRSHWPQHLDIYKWPPEHHPLYLDDKARDQHDTMLGERCDWFETMSFGALPGQHQCRTADGIVLKEKTFGFDSVDEFVATRLSRRPLALDEVMPLAELLDPKFWGLD
jgi:hypothetical protein